MSTLGGTHGRRAQTVAELEARVAELTAELEVATSARTRAEDEVRRLSVTDELTGLPNRRGFRLLADKLLENAHRSGAPAVLLFADLDGLKDTNDTHGRQTGDALLIGMAAALRQAFREADVVARLSEDEFAALVFGAPVTPGQLVDRLRGTMAQIAAHLPHGVVFSASVGTAVYADTTTSLDGLLAEADAAMYVDKVAGRHRLRA